MADTKVCLRSTLTLKNLQKSDSGTYFCQEGVHEGSYSFAYVLNVSFIKFKPKIILYIYTHVCPFGYSV